MAFLTLRSTWKPTIFEARDDIILPYGGLSLARLLVLKQGSLHLACAGS